MMLSKKKEINGLIAFLIWIAFVIFFGRYWNYFENLFAGPFGGFWRYSFVLLLFFFAITMLSFVGKIISIINKLSLLFLVAPASSVNRVIWKIIRAYVTERSSVKIGYLLIDFIKNYRIKKVTASSYMNIVNKIVGLKNDLEIMTEYNKKLFNQEKMLIDVLNPGKRINNEKLKYLVVSAEEEDSVSVDFSKHEKVCNLLLDTESEMIEFRARLNQGG